MSCNASFSVLSSLASHFSFAFSDSNSFSRRAWSALLLAPPVERLFGDLRFLAAQRSRLPVRYRRFNLPQQVHHLLRYVLLPSRHPSLLEVQILSKQLVQKTSNTPLHFADILATRKLHFADTQDAMAKVHSLIGGHDAFEIELYVNRA
jgi:hypothetical protein